MDVRRSINTAMWSDGWFDELDPVEKLLFIYLITNQKTNLLGIYDHTPRRISIDTRIPENDVKDILARFQKDDKVYFTDGWIWVVNWLKNQKWNPKMVRSVQLRFFEIQPSITESFKSLNNSLFDNLLESIDSLSKEYGVPIDKEVKVNSESLNNEKGKVEVGKGEPAKPETDNTTTLPVFLNELLLKEGYSQSTINAEFEKFEKINTEKATLWKDDNHYQNAFKGWMGKAKKDNAGLSEQYYPIIKDRIEGIKEKSGATELNNPWIKYQLDLWGKKTTRVVHNSQGAIDDFTVWLTEAAKEVNKPQRGASLVRENIEGLFNINMRLASQLAEILHKIKSDQVRISKNVPPAFYLDQSQIRKHIDQCRSGTQEIYSDLDFEEKWDSLLKGHGIESIQEVTA